MNEKKENSYEKRVLLGAVIVIFLILGVAGYFIKTVLSGDKPRKKNTVTVVMLKPPPPPPPVPEKIEEIEEEKIVEPEPVPQEADADQQDNDPAGDDLGVDAEGGAGSDAFGLVGKKGGRDLLASEGMGKFSLLTRFADYSQMVEAEIRKRVMKCLDEDGGMPKGKHQVIAKVSVDSNGVVVALKIIGSSGNNKIDGAVMESVKKIQISSPPPDGMPKTMVIRITSKG